VLKVGCCVEFGDQIGGYAGPVVTPGTSVQVRHRTSRITEEIQTLFQRTLPSPRAEAAIKSAKEMKAVYETIHDNMLKAQRNSISYVNKKRKTAPQLKEGDKVYLYTQNLRTQRPSKGLDHVKVGPFLVSEKNGPVTYTLELPPDTKIYPRFHVKLLEPADPDTPLQRTFRYETEEENEFEIEKTLARRGNNHQKEFLVKWLGYDDSENTWEPETNLTNCRQLLARYRQTLQAPKPPTGEPSKAPKVLGDSCRADSSDEPSKAIIPSASSRSSS
jgi:hypothetical protein